MDHYRCNLYYISETWGYHILGSTELFPQHCQLPDMSPHQHVRALTHKLTEGATAANNTTKGKQLLRMLRDCITAMLAPPPTQEEQRVALFNDQKHKEAEQRVSNATPILTIPRITDAPGIMDLRNPMNKCALKATPRTHRRMTWNYMPGILTAPVSPATCMPIPSGVQQRLVTQHAIKALMCNKREQMNLAFTPKALLPAVVEGTPSHIEHFALPMVHP
jgi:hypothetical protein